jgi:hypothetical protein
MRTLFRSRRVRTPSGAEWRVGRQWSPRGLPRWRRPSFGDDAEDTLDTAWAVSAFDVGGFDSIATLLGGIVLIVVLAVILVPLFVFGVELVIAGVVLAVGIVARSAFGRPWIVRATPTADPAAALAWKVRGWRRSEQLIEEIATELGAGLMPSPGEDRYGVSRSVS